MLKAIETSYGGYKFRSLQREMRADASDPRAKLRIGQYALGDIALLAARAHVAHGIAKAIVDPIDAIAVMIAIRATNNIAFYRRTRTAIGAWLISQCAELFRSECEVETALTCAPAIGSKELVESRFAFGLAETCGHTKLFESFPIQAATTASVIVGKLFPVFHAFRPAIASTVPHAIVRLRLVFARIACDQQPTVSLTGTIHEWPTHDTPPVNTAHIQELYHIWAVFTGGVR